MNMKYILTFFLFTFFSISASNEFDAKVVSVDGRGSFSNDVLLMGNCNELTKSQNMYITLSLTYPTEECKGQIKVFYSYYDFPSNKYTEESELCLFSSNKNCKGLFNINLGGKGEDITNVDEFIKLRAVCLSNSDEFTKTLPISINHYPINGELDALTKISEVQYILDDIKFILNDCPQCDSTEYNSVNSKLNEFTYQISCCDFTSYVLRVTEIKKEAEEVKKNYEALYEMKKGNVNVDEKEKSEDEIQKPKPKPKDEIQVEEELDKVKEDLKDVLDDIPKPAEKGLCFIGLIPFFVLISLFIYKTY